ncbi:hypothetical protein L2449_09385 [Mesorhizobium muleiense]|uniref:hypothetical protein n=1 Tax=Mesorhizobium muleiense TaxID=1004279 RepID=UPI001F47A8DC|nr:hypothetical protein [Mesorhizobium muleiense]MCF6117125.1 hypothetical protein [Mesorhizobium muleiense]
MSAKMRADYARAIATRIHSRTETTGRWTTLDDAIEDAQDMLTDAAPDREAILREHLARLTAWREEADLILGRPNIAVKPNHSERPSFDPSPPIVQRS